MTPQGERSDDVELLKLINAHAKAAIEALMAVGEPDIDEKLSTQRAIFEQIKSALAALQAGDAPDTPSAEQKVGEDVERLKDDLCEANLRLLGCREREKAVRAILDKWGPWCDDSERLLNELRDAALPAPPTSSRG